MNTRRWHRLQALPLAMLVAACGDDGGGGTDTLQPDTVGDVPSDTAPDTSDDTLADTSPDTLADTSPDTLADTTDDTQVPDSSEVDSTDTVTPPERLVFGDDYGADVSFKDFGGATNAVSVDTDTKYAGAASLKVVVPTSGYTGGALAAAAPEDLSGFDAVTFWAKASADYTLNVVGFGNDAATSALQVEWTGVALTTEWKRYIIPIPDAAKLSAEAGLFHFAEGAEAAAYTLWFDDIRYEVLPEGTVGAAQPAIATESITREVGGTAVVNGASVTYDVAGTNQTLAVARAYFDYTSSNETVATVDATGTVTAKALGTAEITAALGETAAAGKLTLEVIDAQVPAEAAPTPAQAASDVISLYSNAYTNVTVDTWSAGWDSADLSDVQIAGNDTKKYSALVFAGVEFTSAVIDATTMTHFHIDVWSPDATNFKVKLVDFGPNGVWQGSPNDDSEHELTFDATTTPAFATKQWVSLDIPLASFTGLAGRAHLAQMIVSSSNATVYVDNVYFYKGSAPTAPTTAAPAPSHAAADVISLFSDAYTDVTVDTWSAPWDSADVSDVTIAGDAAKRYDTLVFAGIEFTSAVIDASAMTHFHLDVWSPDAGVFKVKLVDFGANGVWQGTPNDDTEHELTFDSTTTPAVVTGQWLSFDIPLSSFTGLTGRAHLAQLILVSSGGTVFVDNVYFHK